MAEKTLIIDDDVDTLKLVGMMLQRQGYKILAANSGAQGLTVAENELPDIILLDLMMPQMDGYEVARRLRANPETAHIPILMFTARTQIEDRVAGFESGADAYLTKPAHPAELQTQVRSLLDRNKDRPRQATSPVENMAYAVGVIAARGGTGVTTVALNLASSLNQSAEGDVVLAELRPGQGSLGMDLDLTSPRNLSDLLAMQPGEITRSKIRDVLVEHPSGLRLLLASFQPRDLTLISNTQQFETLAQRLAFMARFVIYDFGAGLTAFSQRLAKIFCGEVIIVVEPTPTAIIHTRALLENLVDLGVDQHRLINVVNYRNTQETPLTPAQVENQLGQPLAVTITPAGETLGQARSAHAIPVLMEPDNLLRQQFLTLAQQVIGRAPAARK
jgi:CheY-like chemotaxis protein/MinD-like ATPase involved in chromosome partitioning or flagellar assembly